MKCAKLVTGVWGVRRERVLVDALLLLQAANPLKS